MAAVAALAKQLRAGALTPLLALPQQCIHGPIRYNSIFQVNLGNTIFFTEVIMEVD